MAIDHETQLYKGNFAYQPHKFLVRVSATPVFEPGRLANMNPSSNPSQNLSNRPLHFVNADVGTITTRRSGRKTRDVKSHLSGHYRRWKKQQTLSLQAANNQEKPLPSPPKQHQQQQQQQPPQYHHHHHHHRQQPTNTTTNPNHIEGEIDDHDKSSFTTFSTKDSISSCDGTSPEQPLSHDDQTQIIEPTTLQNALTHGNSDPFNAFPIAIDPQTNWYIQLYHEGTTIMCWTKQIDPRLCFSLQHEGTMHGVLAIAKIITATYLPGYRSPASLIPESRQHYGKLLRLMRAYIADQANMNLDVAIEMMHAATMFCFLALDYYEFEVHLKSLKAFIDSCGGLNKVDPYHSLRFLNADRIRALFLQQKSLTKVDEWKPGSWYEEEQFRRYDQMFERGRHWMSALSQPLLPTGRFSKRTEALIEDYRDMLSGGSVAAMLVKSKQPGFAEITHWLNFRSHALSIYTAAIIRDISFAKQARPSLELSLHTSACLAANFVSQLIYYAQKQTIGLSYIPFSSLVQNLREVADYYRYDTGLQHADLYLWTLFVGACVELASRTWSCNPRFRGSSWCSVNLAHMIDRLAITTLPEFQDRLRQFIFPVMFFPYMKVLFEKRRELVRLS